MRANELYELVRQGKKPLIKFKETFFDEAFCEAGMIARVVSAGESEFGEGYKFGLDYMENKAHNMSLQASDWRIYKDGKQVGTGTAVEAGSYSEDNLVEDMYIDHIDDEVPAGFVEDGLLMEFASSSLECSYVEFLEQKVAALTATVNELTGKGES